MAKQKPRRDIDQEVTDKILGFIEAGNLPPWRMPILGRGKGGSGHPKNLISKKPYRGINVFLLAITAWLEGFTSDYWLTFRQAKERGGAVKKGEKASLVTFWKQIVKEDDDGQTAVYPCLRHYNVFNAEQCQGIVAPDFDVEAVEPQPFEALAAAEIIVDGYQNPPTIERKGKKAVYIRSLDRVEIAPPEAFVSPEEFYSTLFHELGHSTGHEKRLNREREDDHVFGSPSYAKEELVAEFTAALLCGQAGISPPTIENSASYIDGWRRRLQGDSKLVIRAAGQGQRAADHVLGVSFDEDAEGPAPVP